MPPKNIWLSILNGEHLVKEVMCEFTKIISIFERFFKLYLLFFKGELDFVRTKWDRSVDENSVNPGKQIFEKMISGMYMGELIRQVLLDLMKDDLIFFNCNREKLLERGSFYTRFASEIESDAVGDYTR